VARLSEKYCEVCGCPAAQWRVQIGGDARTLCAGCTRRFLARIAPETAACAALISQPHSTPRHRKQNGQRCTRCGTELELLAHQGIAGCADCYHHFPYSVEQWLQRCALPIRHVGEPLPDEPIQPECEPLSAQQDAFWIRAIRQPQTMISSRARYARNFRWAPFPWRADSSELQQVCQRVEKAARSSTWRFSILPIRLMKPSERQRWIDLRLSSPHLRNNPLHGALIVDEARSISVLVNEEDHLRVQAVLPGSQVRESIALARAALDALALQEELAFSDNYGWLTASLLNVGWGLRVSVMMHTPALERTGQLQSVWQAAMELGGTVRGLYGEGTPVSALFQVSNAHSLGVDEATIAAQVAGTAHFIAQAEQQAQEQLLAYHAKQLREEAEQVYHNLGKERTLRAADTLQLLSVVRLASLAGWGNLSAEVWKQMLMAVRWEAPDDDAEWRAIRMRTLVRHVRDG
jgi:protein arginine kinase